MRHELRHAGCSGDLEHVLTPFSSTLRCMSCGCVVTDPREIQHMERAPLESADRSASLHARAIGFCDYGHGNQIV